MKAVILAGGLGTRLGELTEVVPKPMVKIGGRPILWHIMSHYAKYGIEDFVVALGYKSDVVKSYFLGQAQIEADVRVELRTGKVEVLRGESPDWTVTLLDTGLSSMTGERLRRVSPYLGNETFMLTYGDGLSNVNLDELLKLHRKQGSLVTMTAVRPTARFGELEINENRVTKFAEKPQLGGGWINGGFFVMEPEFLERIPEEDVMLEREPLEAVAESGELAAFRHEGFWQCMDTKRDLELLTGLWEGGNPPWSLNE